MRDEICCVEVGVHPAPYWRDANNRVDGPVCTRHREQFNERASWDDEFGPYDWQPYDPLAAESERAMLNNPAMVLPQSSPFRNEG